MQDSGAFCVHFLIHNLRVLFKDYYSVNYKIQEDHDNRDDVTYIAACTHSNRVAERNRELRESGTEVEKHMVTARTFFGCGHSDDRK